MHSCFLYDLKSRMHSGYSTQLSCKLPPAKEEVNVFVRVHLSVCLSVCLIARLLKNVWFYKKLSCRREVARCFVSVSSWLYCFNSIIPPAQFFIISYFGFGFNSAYNSILFCCLRRNVEPCCHTHDSQSTVIVYSARPRMVGLALWVIARGAW